MAGARTLLVFSASVTLMSLKPVLVHNAQAAGTAPLDAKFFLLFAEALKVAICLAALGWRYTMLGPGTAKLWKGLQHTAPFAWPAAAYLVMNWSTVYAMAAIPPATYQLIANVKIMTTAVLGWMVLSRQLRPTQWVSLVVLTFSTALGQWAGHEGPLDASVRNFFWVLFNATISAMGGVLTERVLKAEDSRDLSIFATNIHMAAHTLALNGAALAASSAWAGRPPLPRLSRSALLALGNEALNGILLSSIMRFADSNVKNYAFSISVFTTVGVSAPLFGYYPRPGFFVGAVLVIISLCLYTRPAVAKQKQK